MTYGHDEAVRETSDGVRELVSELDVVMIQPASVNLSDTIEGGY